MEPVIYLLWGGQEKCGGGFEIEKITEHDEARIVECVFRIIGHEALNIMPLTCCIIGQ